MENKTTTNLSSSLTKLSSSSRGIPSDKDFHFYYNFDDFKNPVQNISDKSQSMLGNIGRSELLGKDMLLPGDNDEACNWLENVNDEILERFDCSLDEFQKLRKSQEDNNGFQLVSGRKKKGANQVVSKEASESSGSSEVKVASRDKKVMGMKPRVPFHIPSIRRPQDEYKILVNNLNQPFEHVWLQRSEDGSRVIHPLENFSALDFVDKKIIDIETAKPPPIEISPYKLVEELKDLKELAAKLRGVDEFAVDLEHNQYRSFQGLTCLMQISTRKEDFIVDTLKLRIHIGPYLREVFKDPTKKKVMHGADRDVIWLQRDFGIYICNLFDTGQASRVLKMERNSLEYLLHHFCGVAANKEYQNADWRLRPLTEEMLRYAREDTHYLLHIYDLMRIRLLCSSSDSEYYEASLVEVYQRSYDICMQLYEKEVMTDSSFLYIYGLQDANLNARQLAIVAGLCEWRDVVARTEDESTGYVLPNKTLLEIAKQMPVTITSLHQLVKSKHPYVECHLGSIVSIIRHSIQNASAYEDIAEQLKEGRTEAVSAGNLVVADESEMLSPEVPVKSKATIGAEGKYATNRNLLKHLPAPVQLKEKPLNLDNNNDELNRNQPGGCSESAGHNRDVKSERDGCVPAPSRESYITSEQLMQGNLIFSHSVSGAEATVQVLKCPTRAFGTLLGNPAAKRKFDPGRKEKGEVKLEQIKSSVNLPFHSLLGRVDEVQPAVKETAKALQSAVKETDKPLVNSCHEEPDGAIVTESRVQDIIPLNSDSGEKPVNNEPKSTDGNLEQNRSNTSTSGFEFDEDDETVSLADLSSSFKKCFQSTNEEGKVKQLGKSQESLQHFKPFDYAAARKQVSFCEDQGGKKGEVDDESRRSKRDAGSWNKNSSTGQGDAGEESGSFQLGRRRQALSWTGNRSSTFR